MSRQRGFDPHMGSFFISHFADHNDIWICSQKRAHSRRKRQPNLRLYLQLPQARLGNFYRILYGPYLFLNVVDLGQHRMKCRRFT